MDVGVELADFFLIFCEAMISERRYFLNKLSKAARASLALRGAGVLSTGRWAEAGAGASRATVTMAAKNSQVLA